MFRQHSKRDRVLLYTFFSAFVDISFFILLVYWKKLRDVLMKCADPKQLSDANTLLIWSCLLRLIIYSLFVCLSKWDKSLMKVLLAVITTLQTVLLVALGRISVLIAFDLERLDTFDWIFFSWSVISQLSQILCTAYLYLSWKQMGKLHMDNSSRPLLDPCVDDTWELGDEDGAPPFAPSSWAKDAWAKLEYVRGVLASSIAEIRGQPSEIANRIETGLLLRLIAGEDVAEALEESLLENPSFLYRHFTQLADFAFCLNSPGAVKLRTFLFDQCSQHLRLALRLCWHFQAFMPFSTVKIPELAEMLSGHADRLSSRLQRPSDDIGFKQSLLFFEKLGDISKQLTAHAVGNSFQNSLLTIELKKMLSCLQESLLPYRLVYLPLRNGCFRICNILIEDCQPFPTKDRVPILIVLEVVDEKDTKRFDEKKVADFKDHHKRSPGIFSFVKRASAWTETLFGSESSHDEKDDDQTLYLESGDHLKTSQDEALDLRSFWNFPGAIPPPNSVSSSRSNSLLGVDISEMRSPFQSLKKYRDLPLLRKPRSRWDWLFKHFSPARNRLPSWEISETDAWTELAQETQQMVYERQFSFSEDFRLRSSTHLETWADKEISAKKDSEFSGYESWRLVSLIVKAEDDLRQEEVVSGLMQAMSEILIHSGHGWLRPYEVIAIAPGVGIIEAVPNTVNLHTLRKQSPRDFSLKKIFTERFGPVGSKSFKTARRNFISSLAAYCIACYLLQLKDRHNANIMLDQEGHIIHVDFGFVFGRGPGGIRFEKAPFKLTMEFVELMGGNRSKGFLKFRSLCCKIFLDLRRERSRILLLVDIASNCFPKLPCFRGFLQGSVTMELRSRFCPELSKHQCIQFVNHMIDESLDNWTTRWYDKYQWWFVGIV